MPVSLAEHVEQILLDAAVFAIRPEKARGRPIADQDDEFIGFAERSSPAVNSALGSQDGSRREGGRGDPQLRRRVAAREVGAHSLDQPGARAKILVDSIAGKITHDTGEVPKWP